MAPNYEQTKAEGVAALLEGMSSLLTSEKFTDLTVEREDRSWHVHKTIVCARSAFFVKACEGGFKDAEGGVVTLYDDEPDVIDKMLHYMYNNQYCDADTDTPPVLFNVRMVASAEKYFVDHLAHLAISKLDCYTESAWGSEAFADAISEAYTTTADSDRRLRETLLQVVVSHADALFDQGVTAKYPHFLAMAAKTPSFSLDAANLLVKVPRLTQGKEATYRCPGESCNVVFTSSMDREATAKTIRRTCEKCGDVEKRTCAEWQKMCLVVGTPLEELGKST
ncbi:hypothetical protein LTR53_013100 [Teratosphaeriaceae sp. CCFEE 6253]|nr:hypothetical protein LTR53_013100 [Teratosphaeriaceae sp. CCFEE 6253]